MKDDLSTLKAQNASRQADPTRDAYVTVQAIENQFKFMITKLDTEIMAGQPRHHEVLAFFDALKHTIYRHVQYFPPPKVIRRPAAAQEADGNKAAPDSRDEYYRHISRLTRE